jgi:hypothetical protein
MKKVFLILSFETESLFKQLRTDYIILTIEIDEEFELNNVGNNSYSFINFKQNASVYKVYLILVSGRRKSVNRLITRLKIEYKIMR